MPDALAGALATPGLVALIATIAIAGLVRGFTGFGTALIFVPVANLFLPPAAVILALVITGIGSTFVLVPRAWREGTPREVGVMAGFSYLTLPLGVALITLVDPIAIRWAVTVVAAITLAVLISGIRYRGHIGLGGLGGVGAAVGVIGGSTGLTGPPVILFYLGSAERAAAQVRANTILFLAAVDIGLALNLAFADHFSAETVWLGLILTLPYMIFTRIGAWAFRPGYETLYRRAAYLVIGLAILTGLPLFD